MSHLTIRSMVGRLVTVAAAVVTASAISSVAYAAPAERAAPATVPCTGAGDLHLRIAGSQNDKAAGITYYTLDFTNTSRSTCSLSGYPYVSMISKKGSQLGSPAGRGLMTLAPLVRLAPGATAHTTLAYHRGMVSARRGCGPVANAFELRVYVAGQKLALYAAMGVHACSHSGQAYLTITQPFRAGAGSS
jgi:hypothetical protein